MADPQHADMLAAWNEPRRGANQCEHGHHYRACPFCERDREIADLRIELANLRAADIHSCGPTCTRAGCVNGRLRESIAEALRLLGTEPQSARAVLLDAVRADSRTLQAQGAGLESTYDVKVAPVVYSYRCYSCDTRWECECWCTVLTA